jgi:hypothetical protein
VTTISNDSAVRVPPGEERKAFAGLLGLGQPAKQDRNKDDGVGYCQVSQGQKSDP